MPVLSVDASQATEIWEAVTPVRRRFAGADGALTSLSVVTTARSLVDLFPLGSIASTQR
jgi:hypothetical protein